MKSEPTKPSEPEIEEHGNAAKPISFHPLTVAPIEDTVDKDVTV